MREFTLRLTEAEVNAALQVLGGAPYAAVFELIAKIQGQCAAQARPPAAAPPEE
jgi:hypothetical protein